MPTAKTIQELTDRYGAKYALTCGISHYFPQMRSTSKVFWVEGNLGDDDAPDAGQTPDAPLMSLTKALSYCTNDANDYIFVANHYAPTSQTYPVQISKSFVHIIGDWGMKSPTWLHADAAGTTVPAIEFIAGGANCELANLELGAGTAGAGIKCSANGLWANYIHHCRFGMALGMGALNGIELATSGEMNNWIIEHCRFGELLTGAGIEMPATLGGYACRGTIIRNNIFRVANSAKGINVADAGADFEDGGIFDNKFIVRAADPGGAIFFNATAKGAIDGNHVVNKDVKTALAVTDTSIHIGADGTGVASWGVNYYSGTLCTASTDYTE